MNATIVSNPRFMGCPKTPIPRSRNGLRLTLQRNVTRAELYLGVAAKIGFL